MAKLYQSPPGSGSNDGALPQRYDPTWQGFENLTPQQRLAFQSFPADLIKYVSIQRQFAEVSGLTVAGIPLTTEDRDQAKIGQLKQAFDTGVLNGALVSFFDANGTIHSVDATAASAIYQGVVLFVQSTYSTAATLVAGIKATPPTVTTRKTIDAAFAAIAPNSPSGTNPSPT